MRGQRSISSNTNPLVAFCFGTRDSHFRDRNSGAKKTDNRPQLGCFDHVFGLILDRVTAGPLDTAQVRSHFRNHRRLVGDLEYYGVADFEWLQFLPALNSAFDARAYHLLRLLGVNRDRGIVSDRLFDDCGLEWSK